ncbi:helix-turn-helix domain-containing protein [Virgibacillus ihumii]|uniref:helix-turn-helix domain-containing protein n=1 Tax=Virgibacillus ihumii TaxID=2686091 RepID=UPI00157BF9DA|nr:helix-turn-helix domain-containing protein [Virgibacillus ihumii]
MIKLIDLAEQAKHGNVDAVEDVLERFEPKIKRSLSQTTLQNQADLYQELSIKTMEIIHTYDADKVYGFWEFFNMLKDEQTKGLL